jgi:mitogen-activated protein kinase kinase kinase
MRRTGAPGRGDLAVEDPLYERDEEGEAEGNVEGTSEVRFQGDDSQPPGTWTLEEYMQREQRPGPQPLSGRRRNLSAHHLTSSSSLNSKSGGSTSDSSRTPAAGVGTRVGPRPVPKSSSSLRHISSKARTSSFGVPLHEDKDLHLDHTNDYRTVQSSVEAAKRRQAAALDNFLGEVSDDDDELPNAYAPDGAPGWEADLYGSLGKRQASWASSRSNQGSRMDLSGYESSSEEDEAGEEIDTGDSPREAMIEQTTLPDEQPGRTRADRYADADIGGPSPGGPKRAAWHPRGPVQHLDSPPIIGQSSGMMTPGPIFHQTLHTPKRSPDVDPMPTIEPRQRLEWHTMLQSVLRSEVLQSETKRITSADAPSSTKRELMYQRWLDIRASLRGRGHYAGAIEAEEKRLREGWPTLLGQVIESIRQCRSGQEPVDGKDMHIDDASIAVDDTTGIKEKAIAEVGSVLRQIDDAEIQFPSLRKLAEEIPQWTDEVLQKKLDALYTWHSVATSLRTQMRILQKWTGSKTLDIVGHQGTGPDPTAPTEGEVPGLAMAGAGAVMIQPEMEESTFLERILKEDSLQSTFEKRTLRSINGLTLKAKAAMIEHHKAFGEMRLPSFEPELSQLINFPTRLMEGALKLRLDYAIKLKEPSVLIVDSLTDDMRAAIALACRIKLQYNEIMVQDPAHGWGLSPCIGQGYDTVLQHALQFFFKLLNYKLKGSVFFKETEILEPEWRFLSTAVQAIESGDLIVATSITGFVNKVRTRDKRTCLIIF